MALIAITIETPSSRPHMPHSQPQNNSATKTITALVPPIRCASHRTSRLESGLPIPRNRQSHFACIGPHRLRTRAVADITRRLLALLPEMTVQFGVQNPFRQRPL
jgi:hypothetical protein